MDNGRSLFRYRTERVGKVLLDGGGAMDCVIRNISSGGVSIEVASPEKVPDKFILTIQGMPEKHRCHVTWRTGNKLGVEYL